MNINLFWRIITKKAKIIVNSSKKRFLSATNGKKLVLILDNINLFEENSKIGKFLKSILLFGYYYDDITHEKIYINNLVIIAAENSSY